jgi:hypothetical protein
LKLPTSATPATGGAKFGPPPTARVRHGHGKGGPSNDQ